ncbi:AraC family transcriptional regulator [Kutzneria chonburiensis]|uniref:AraC family transcriptional regulator n=1 Tax=Kutzneria chonburiensis TaxID=1483604 RepID=A0ABV6MQU9_9PSEU|nr:AraC family transcriptional regulator [Kutzneria chonburiensis]
MDMPTLAGHEVVDTTDVDEARLVGSRLFRDHQLLPDTRGVKFRAVLRSTVVGGLTLSHVDHRAGVRIVTAAPSNGFLVHVPLTGRADITCGRDRITSDPATAVVIDPAERLDMTWSSGTPQLIVGIDRERLELHLGRVLGRTLDRPLRFSLGMDLTSAAARAWLDVMALLLREVSSGEPVAPEQMEALIFQRFLLAQANTYSEALGEDRPVASRAVRKAMALIESHAAEPLTVEDLAEAVGVGVRSLQIGFRRFADTTPMSYLRDVRLRRVHAELLAAQPGGETVTDIATRWGFLHAGWFSVLYRERFGEKPSTTLHR